MADTQDSTEVRVGVRVDIAKEVDRALEAEATRLDITKRELVETALRAFLKIPKGNAA